LSSTKSDLSTIPGRIIALSSSYATYKEFLDICGIDNHSFISDLKSGANKNPGAERLAQIVRATGCSGTWLLTGKGEKFPPDREEVRKDTSPGEAYIADVMQARRLMERIEQKSDAVKDAAQLDDLAVQTSKLTTKILEIRQQSRKERDS
jgi:transcriptional regulator with XRE-family HTH domain